MDCTRWHNNQQAYLEVICKESKTDDVICLYFGVYGNICGHMVSSSVSVSRTKAGKSDLNFVVSPIIYRFVCIQYHVNVRSDLYGWRMYPI